MSSTIGSIVEKNIGSSAESNIGSSIEGSLVSNIGSNIGSSIERNIGISIGSSIRRSVWSSIAINIGSSIGSSLVNIKTKVCASTFNSLHRLGEKIKVTLYWIQAGTKPYGLRRAIELSGEGTGVRHGLQSRYPYPVGKLIFRKYQERLLTSGGQITLKDTSRKHGVISSSKNWHMLTGIGFA